MYEPGNVTVEDMLMPTSSLEPTDAIIAGVTRICGLICGPIAAQPGSTSSVWATEYVGTVIEVRARPSRPSSPPWRFLPSVPSAFPGECNLPPDTPALRDRGLPGRLRRHAPRHPPSTRVALADAPW